MASYNTSAQITLSVNGQQARQMMSSLEKDAQRLERQIAAAAQAGDKATMQKLQRELRSTRSTMNQLRGSAATTEQVLARLDRATPKELQKALRQLKRELNGIERGTTAWDEQTAKIRAVRQEIARMNEELRSSQTLGERVMGWFSKWKGAVLGVAASLTGVVALGKKAVDDYASMQEEMAGVTKFSGLDPEQVRRLNEEFKQMDTRTSREQLNRLAQEAGRLGKTSQEDILGFVRAADQINVALDELGEGATLTLSKLTSVFGDEERLGTEKALLSVGSVINDLSQNCAASAPYLTEFAARMGGVASQAGMTIPQVMSFAAVLDSSGVNVERSSTALAKVITHLYQDPARYAQAAGMDVQRFSELVRTDMNGALMELLGTLQQTGGMEVIAPIFADMGENASGAVEALSTLAREIDNVSRQQAFAAESYEKATSITNEAAIANGTVAARLEKAKQAVHELSVALGEKLWPVMTTVLTTTGTLIQVAMKVIDFIAANGKSLLWVAGCVAAYNAGLLITRTRAAIAAVGVRGLTVVQKAHAAAQVAATAASKLWSAAMLLLTGHVKAAKTAFQAFSATLKASPWGLVLTAITAVVGIISTFIDRNKEAKEAQKRQQEETERQRQEFEKWKKSLTDVNSAAASYCKDELARLDSLYRAATDEAASKEKRIDAAKRLIALYPEQFRNMSAEQIMLGKAKAAYDALRDSILRVAEAKAAAELIKENAKENVSDRMSAQDAEKALAEATKRRNRLRQELQRWRGDIWNNPEAWNRLKTQAKNKSAKGLRLTEDEVMALSLDSADQDVMRNSKIRNDAYRRINHRHGANNQLYNTYGSEAGFMDAMGVGSGADAEVPTVSGGIGTAGSGSGTGSGTADKLAAEKAWREMAQAQARVAYAKGETDLVVHTERMNEIEVEYYEKVRAHQDLTEKERLEAESGYYEAKRKQELQWHATSLQELEQAYSLEIAELKQQYLTGKISRETYQRQTQKAEIEHQKIIVELEKAGTQERAEAEANLTDMLIKEMDDRKAAIAQKIKEIYDARKKREEQLKQQYFGDNAAEKKAAYLSDLSALEAVYKAELIAAGENADEKLRIEKAYWAARAALAKEYGQEDETGNILKKGIEGFGEWLQGDGGKILTGALSTVTSGMSGIFSQLSSMMQAELEIQMAQIEKRYDTEIARAEGNSYKVAKLEKQKEAEIAKAKNEANRRQFSMQVIQAVAQTAQNALSAYGSAAAIPVVGYILAPIAAAMATAAGMMQVAAIKKQQQASEAQGYSDGGFTPRGRKDEPVGVVHAGEWVASQRLVNNPRVRPLLEALDQAQRTNTIGSITMADVSRSVTAPMVQAATGTGGQSARVVVEAPQAPSEPRTPSELTETLSRLSKRLQEPFVTVNTVTGDYGLKRAQDEYARLIRNKSRKKR